MLRSGIVATLLGAAVLLLISSPASADVFDNVDEAGDYTLVYSFDIPELADFKTTLPQYAVDKSDDVSYFDRVAYYIELKPAGQDTRWVYVSMKAFTHDPKLIGIPVANTGAHFQENLIDMNVASNVPALITQGQEIQTGNIEFWPNNYDKTNSAGVPGASNDLHDTGDKPGLPVAGYGSMQVHNHGANQTLFAYNRWGLGSTSDLGIGNGPDTSPDWTHQQNAATYQIRKLQVLVREVAPQPSQVAEAGEYDLAYVLDIPGNAATNFHANGVPYAMNVAADIEYPERVAYYLELQKPGGELQWIWVSMDSFADDPSLFGVPNSTSGAFFQQDVENLHVEAGAPGIVEGDFQSGGNIEFWPNNYGKSNVAGVPGASSNAYDTGDEPVTPAAGYGSMQVHNHEEEQVLFAYNGWGAVGKVGDLGIGNAPADEEDWTHHENVPSYFVKTLWVFVKSGVPPVVTVDLPKPLFVVQRDDKNKGIIDIQGTLASPVNFVEARVVPREGFGGTETQWKVVDPIPAPGSFKGTISVSSGWYDLEVRVKQGLQVVDTAVVHRVGVGEIFVTAGQSNSANSGQPPQVPTDERVVAHDLKTHWKKAADPQPIATGVGGSPWPDLGDILAEKYDLPIGFVSVGWGGTSVTQWQPDGNDKYPRLKKAVEFLGANGFRAVLWHQGESDNNGGMNTLLYAELLQNIIDQSRLDAGFDLPWRVALVSYTPTKGLGENIINGQLQVIENDPLTFEGPGTDDLIGDEWRHDGIHFNDAGLYEHALRWSQKIDLNVCGDTACMAEETCASCPGDCGVCCGNGECDGEFGETNETCPADCPAVCGDVFCNTFENCKDCPEDCGICCPNNSCDLSFGEDCMTCPADCGGCCGNAKCDGMIGEDCTTCPADCGSCCGDDICNPALSEACNTCPADCGLCCGDGDCDPGLGEDCMTCPADCGCCPNCNDKQCGEDGCGGSCGECEPGSLCEQGQCVLPPEPQPELVPDVISGPDGAETVASQDAGPESSNDAVGIDQSTGDAVASTDGAGTSPDEAPVIINNGGGGCDASGGPGTSGLLPLALLLLTLAATRWRWGARHGRMTLVNGCGGQTMRSKLVLLAAMAAVLVAACGTKDTKDAITQDVVGDTVQSDLAKETSTSEARVEPEVRLPADLAAADGPTDVGSDTAQHEVFLGPDCAEECGPGQDIMDVAQQEVETPEEVVAEVVPEEVTPEVDDEDTSVVQPEEFVGIEVKRVKSGGFMGGHVEQHLKDGSMHIWSEFSDLDCTVPVPQEDINQLMVAAADVAWDAVKETYVNPANPYCCCDQFVYAVEVTLMRGDGSSVKAATNYCDEQLFSNEVPQDLLGFVGAYSLLAQQLQNTCP